MTTDISPADAATLPVTAPEPDDLGDARYHGEDALPAHVAPDDPAPEQERGTEYLVFLVRPSVHIDSSEGGEWRDANEGESADTVYFKPVAKPHEPLTKPVVARGAKEAIRAVRAARVKADDADGDEEYRAVPARNWTGLGFTRKETVVEEEVEL